MCWNELTCQDSGYEVSFLSLGYTTHGDTGEAHRQCVKWTRGTMNQAENGRTELNRAHGFSYGCYLCSEDMWIHYVG